MKTKTQHFAVILSALVLMTGAVVAQNSSDNETDINSTLNNTDNISSELGDGVRAYNFVIKGLPAQASEEAEEIGKVDAEKEFETEPDSNRNFSISESKAEEIAIEELGSNEWNLTDLEKSSEGVYEFSFKAGESEAEVNVDGSSGNVTRLEGEIEYEPKDSEKRESPVISLTGFVEFNTGGYEVDVESETEENTVNLTVKIEDPEGSATQAISRVPVKETLETEGGDYTVNLNVVRGSETVLQTTEKVTIPESSEEKEDSRFKQDPENMTREELVEEVKDLRERIIALTKDPVSQPDGADDNQKQNPPKDVPAQPEDEDKDSETPGQGNSNRPGFVNRILEGIFG